MIETPLSINTNSAMELPQQCLKNGTSDSMSSMFTLQGSKLYMSRDTWGGIIKHNRSEYDSLIP